MSVLCWDYNKYHTFIFLHRLYSDNSLFVTLIKCFSVGFFFSSNACWMNVMNVGRMKMKDDDRWWRMMTDGALGRRCNRGRTVAEDLLDGWTFKSFMGFFYGFWTTSPTEENTKEHLPLSVHIWTTCFLLCDWFRNQKSFVWQDHTHTHTLCALHCSIPVKNVIYSYLFITEKATLRCPVKVEGIPPPFTHTQ